MSVSEHIKKLYDSIPDGSMVICHAGIPVHTNEDDYYGFEVNSQFFYLTGLERESMIFMAVKTDGKTSETLFIEEADPLAERWTGKMPTKDGARSVSGIDICRDAASSGSISIFTGAGRAICPTITR